MLFFNIDMRKIRRIRPTGKLEILRHAMFSAFSVSVRGNPRPSLFAGFQIHHGVGFHAEQQIAVFIHPVGDFRQIVFLVDQIQFRTAQIESFHLQRKRQIFE